MNFSGALLVALVAGLEKGKNLTSCLFVLQCNFFIECEGGQHQVHCFLYFHSKFKLQFYLASDELLWTTVPSVPSAFLIVPGLALPCLPASESTHGEACKGRTNT